MLSQLKSSFLSVIEDIICVVPDIWVCLLSGPQKWPLSAKWRGIRGHIRDSPALYTLVQPVSHGHSFCVPPYTLSRELLAEMTYWYVLGTLGMCCITFKNFVWAMQASGHPGVNYGNLWLQLLLNLVFYFTRSLFI